MSLPAGWLPLTWSPDGTWLLEARGNDLGRVDPSDPQKVVPLGRFTPAGVFGAAWIGPGAPDPYTGPTPGRRR